MCTGIKLRPEDGSIIFSRTVEFGVDGRCKPAGIPSGEKYVGSAPEDRPGQAWTSKYAAIGMDVRGTGLLIDGLNEKGLHVGAFNFSEFAVYQDVAPANYDKRINCFELPNYLLTTTATVDEAIAVLR